jgi:hypothetical protein
MIASRRPTAWLALAAMAATLALPMRGLLHTLGHARTADRVVAMALCTATPRPADAPSHPAPASHATCVSACCATAAPAAPPSVPYAPSTNAVPGPPALGQPAAIVAAWRTFPPPARAPPTA